MQRLLPARRAAELVGDFDRSPAYRGLSESLRVLIGDGRIPRGVRLPSERELTDSLGVSRTTVSRAYAELREHGYLTSRQGSGWVATLPAGRGHRGDPLLPSGAEPGGAIDLTVAAPLPGPGVLAAYERAVAELPAYLAGTGYYPSGLPVLREAVAASYAARGLATSPDQIVIVPGALAGVAVAAHTLISRGDRVVLESPNYPNAIATLRGRGARVVGADADDWAASVTATVAQTRAAAAYLIPDFHNPTGALRSDDERATVAAALRRHHTIPIIDESMVALGLDDDPMPAPFAAHLDDAVSVGSLSKPFWGGLRVGWLRVPGAIVDRIVRTRVTLDLGVAPLEQLVATDLLHSGADLLAHRHRQLRESRAAALGALAAHLPAWETTRPRGGLNLWCRLPQPLSSDLAPTAAAHDVLLAPGPSFAPEGGLNSYLRIPYTQPAELLTEAIRRVARAWDETVASQSTRAARGVAPTLVA
jgi:DNA-binding transcriptional MocR family regulator